MVTSLQIFTGIVIGCAGLFQILDNPLHGSAALLISGSLILSGIDRMCRLGRDTE